MVLGIDCMFMSAYSLYDGYEYESTILKKLIFEGIDTKSKSKGSNVRVRLTQMVCRPGKFGTLFQAPLALEQPIMAGCSKVWGRRSSCQIRGRLTHVFLRFIPIRQLHYTASAISTIKSKLEPDTV